MALSRQPNPKKINSFEQSSLPRQSDDLGDQPVPLGRLFAAQATAAPWLIVALQPQPVAQARTRRGTMSSFENVCQKIYLVVGQKLPVSDRAKTMVGQTKPRYAYAVRCISVTP